MSVVPQGRSVQALYSDFREGNLLVNRRYQRKLAPNGISGVQRNE